jgi:site-specific DNA recombinase
VESAVALYFRLSQEDVDARGNSLKDESNSIQSQRFMLRSFIANHPDLNGRPIMEFADDGFTGTNFDRPNFQQMMERVKSGDVSCIVVKDLSRFGRNYLEVGDYLEHLFPFLGVRFIAINDHYDSNDYVGSTGGLDVAFRNLIYQRYSQDLSEKVKSAKHMRMAQGKHICSCPYGYMKKPGIKDKMFIDPVTGPIVRDIFLNAINGMKTTEIAAHLNERGIPTPMVYKKLSRKGYENDAMWSHQAVLRIIRDYKYTGAMVTFKCENLTIRAKAQHKRPPEEWTVIEGCHDPIVSHEEYDMANATIRKVRYNPPKKTDQRDRVYFCGHCGRRLRKTFGLDEYYSCATQLYKKEAVCKDIFWSRSDLEEVLLAAYKSQLQLMSEEYSQIIRQPVSDPVKECRLRQKAIEEELASADAKNLQYYEEYRNGSITREAFLQKKGELVRRKELLVQEQGKLQVQMEDLIREQRKLNSRVDQLAASVDLRRESDDELRKRMYDAIDRVTVYCSRELDITWKMGNIFAGTVEKELVQ